MSFLLPYFKERSTICTLPENSEDKHSDIEDTDGTLPIPELKNPQTSASPELTNSHNSALQNSTGARENFFTPQPKRTRIRQTTNKQSSCSETPSTSLMKYILESKSKTNEIQQFFESISTTVQSFPPRDRALAKSKVFAVISEMEMDILSRGITSSDASSRSSSAGSNTPSAYFQLSPEMTLKEYHISSLTPQEEQVQFSIEEVQIETDEETCTTSLLGYGSAQ